MRLALFGYGNVGRAFAALLERKRSAYPFRICAIHTARHGTAWPERPGAGEIAFGPSAASAEEFLDRAKPEVVIELTTLNPESGEPAISHIRTAFARNAHVITANKGPIAHAYSSLRAEALQAGVEFRFESTCMDGAPVFNMVRNNLPGVCILGFTGVLNSTSKVVIDAMRSGRSLQDGIAEAQAMGVAEADPSFDIDGWDSAAKTSALANVLMDVQVRPQDVQRQGIAGLTVEEVQRLAAERRTVCLVSRAEKTGEALRLRVSPEIMHETDLLASVHGTSNMLLLHTDLMGTVGTVSLSPGVEQTAYGVFSDLVDIARTI